MCKNSSCTYDPTTYYFSVMPESHPMSELQTPRKILVLCLGNICRSPMAEGFLKRELPDRFVMSAGIAAMIGHPADPLSVRLMQEHGIDISSHRAQNLTNWMVESADLILTMETEQTRYIERVYPSFRGKLMRIGHFGEFDVPDPFRRGIDAFLLSRKLIIQGVEDMLENVFKQDIE